MSQPSRSRECPTHRHLSAIHVPMQRHAIFDGAFDISTALVNSGSCECIPQSDRPHISASMITPGLGEELRATTVFVATALVSTTALFALLSFYFHF